VSALDSVAGINAHSEGGVYDLDGAVQIAYTLSEELITDAVYELITAR
jgi:hypothetical protein